MISLTSVHFQCVHCGEWNETDFDPSGGLDQQLIEDCAVCCYPLVLRVHCDPADGTVRIDVEEEA